jgi:hypothetical protein
VQQNTLLYLKKIMIF